MTQQPPPQQGMIGEPLQPGVPGQPAPQEDGVIPQPPTPDQAAQMGVYAASQEALVASGVQAVTGQQALMQAQQQAAPTTRITDPDLHFPGQSTVKQGVTVFLFGSVGTWKTTWAGQWPKPLFLSVGAEGGDDALAMLPSLYGVAAPPSFHITSSEMMYEKVNAIRANYLAWDVNTVVVDSITYYVDMWIAQLMAKRYNDPKIKKKIEDAGGMATNMTMRDWGILAMHIRDLAMMLHNTGLNVIWIGLEKEVKESDGQGGGSRTVAVEPYIRGETALKLPGMCKMIIHAHKDLKPDPNAMGRMMIQPVYYTSPNWLTKIVRHKYGLAFPEGKLVDPELGDYPTFRALWSRIGQFVYATA